jgi:hypothetical protein
VDHEIATFLELEARALLARLDRVKPFALHEVMVPAANISPAAQAAVDRYLAQGRRQLRVLVRRFLDSLDGAEARRAAPAEVQRQFTVLRLRFNTVLTQFDLFADALSQRSEIDTGVWLAGLDMVAADALALPGYIEAPPVICYLDRGMGAAIRRARTRLPGGGRNPVAVIRVPRERMIGSGIASSLVHEVGHQAAALLNLVASLRPMLQAHWQNDVDPEHSVWRYWERWISEIVADLWSVARVGVASTVGLILVVSLPRPFVFRINLNDPHPIPWIRVKLSAAIGKALYPSAHWDGLSRLWESLYPTDDLPEAKRALLERLVAGIPDFVSALLEHRPRRLRGESLGAVLSVTERQPAHLSALYDQWRLIPAQMFRAPPALVFAVIGQARAQHKITPEQESDLVARLLTRWALRGTQLESVRRETLQTLNTAVPAT